MRRLFIALFFAFLFWLQCVVRILLAWVVATAVERLGGSAELCGLIMIMVAAPLLWTTPSYLRRPQGALDWILGIAPKSSQPVTAETPPA